MTMECFTGVHNHESGLPYMFKKTGMARIRETRSSHTHKVQTENIRTVTGCKAFGFRGPNLWNKLEVEKRVIEEKAAFKNHISKIVHRDVNHPG